MIKILLLAILLAGFSINLSANELEEKIKSEIDIDFKKNFEKCNFDPSLGTATNFNGKYEFWKTCELENGSSITIIESHKDEEYNKEIFFAKNGKLIYALEDINGVSINDFEKSTNYQWDCHYWINNEKIIDYISLGTGKTESNDWEPESILQIYKDRMFELKYRKVPPLPKFDKNESYTNVRIEMINQGWAPYISEDADTCSENDIRCQDRPEMEACAGTGMANCRFLWKKNGQIIVVHTIMEDAVFSSIADENNTNVDSEENLGSAKADDYNNNSDIGDSIDRSLSICEVFPKTFTKYPVTLADADHGEIRKNGLNIISTMYDVRGSKLIDMIFWKVNFSDRPSCYWIKSIYVYKTNSYIHDRLGGFMYRLFGEVINKVTIVKDFDKNTITN